MEQIPFKSQETDPFQHISNLGRLSEIEKSSQSNRQSPTQVYESTWYTSSAWSSTTLISIADVGTGRIEAVHVKCPQTKKVQTDKLDVVLQWTDSTKWHLVFKGKPRRINECLMSWGWDPRNMNTPNSERFLDDHDELFHLPSIIREDILNHDLSNTYTSTSLLWFTHYQTASLKYGSCYYHARH